MSDQAMDQIRSANPIPHELPAPSIEEVWRRLDADGQKHQLHRGSRPHRSVPVWLPTIGGFMAAISATVVVGIVVAAIALLGHGRTSSPTPSPASATTSTPASGSTTPALGSAIGPQTAAQSTGPGAAILSTVKLVVQTHDPQGGLPWGMREFQTTRGQTCLQVGRVRSGAIGVIGQDGAWANDHRFHPISPNAFTADYCAQTDGNGHAFANIMQASQLASGGAGVTELHIPGCGIVGAHGDPCRKAQLRVLQYGLLGPDAVSMTYLDVGGQFLTEPTTGPDGAYMIVGPATKRLCRTMWRGSGCGREAPGGYAFGPTLEAGLVTAVRYRDGHVCRVPPPPPAGSPAGTPQGSCPVVGYRPPRVGHLTAALLAAPVTARKLPSKLVVDLTFTAHVAVTNHNSYYEYTLDPTGTPSCSNQTGDNTAGAFIRAGQRVLLQDHIKANCAGVLHGTVAYVPNIGPGPGYPAPVGFSEPGPVRSIIVGRFGVAIP